jgi:hypothetical protein
VQIQVNCKKALSFERDSPKELQVYTMFVTFYRDDTIVLKPTKYHTPALFDVRVRREANTQQS